jgi:hypothetical protein
MSALVALAKSFSQGGNGGNGGIHFQATDYTGRRGVGAPAPDRVIRVIRGFQENLRFLRVKLLDKRHKCGQVQACQLGRKRRHVQS